MTAPIHKNICLIGGIVFTLQFLFFFKAHASQSLIGVAGIFSENPRTKMFAGIIDSHLDNILRSNFIASENIFEPINSALFRDQLAKFNCSDESCLFSFAGRAKISVVIRGRIEEQADAFVLELTAFGTDIPYFGKTIHQYSARIPTSNLQLSMREYSYIFEEHCARFISSLLKKYRKPLYVISENGILRIDSSANINGIFTIYRTASESAKLLSLVRHYPVGTIAIRNGRFVTPLPPIVHAGDFILQEFDAPAEKIAEFYEGRKREIVFSPSTSNDTFLMILYTIPGSLTMPLVSPFLGYLNHQDYSGLALWTINALPYAYVAYKGIIERPQLLERDHKDISSSELARYRFTLYMLLCGNMSLFVDAFASHSLYLASNYQGIQRYMGNTLTASYLSLVSGGGGHFYRGWRAWGYFYFHVNNALLYCTIKEFSPSRRYNETSGTYATSDIDKRRALSFLSTYAAFKIVEIVHAALLPDRIQNGTVEETNMFIVPFSSFRTTPDERIYGAAITMRF